jgi:hypothetical protein
VSAEDLDLTIIEQRIASKQTGSQWQRLFLQQPDATLKTMTKAYLEHSRPDTIVIRLRV